MLRKPARKTVERIDRLVPLRDVAVRFAEPTASGRLSMIDWINSRWRSACGVGLFQLHFAFLQFRHVAIDIQVAARPAARDSGLQPSDRTVAAKSMGSHPPP